MAKRIFKSDRMKEIVRNIAADFRYSNDLGEYALLFYKADTEGMVSGSDIDKMVEYVTTGLAELKNEMQWRQEYLQENPNADEIKVLDNMKTIEDEYVDLLSFLKKS